MVFYLSNLFTIFNLNIADRVHRPFYIVTYCYRNKVNISLVYAKRFLLGGTQVHIDDLVSGKGNLFTAVLILSRLGLSHHWFAR